VFGSTRSIRRPAATGEVRVRLRDRCRCAQDRPEDQGRRGRGLLVGGMWHQRMRLAGSPLRRRVDGRPKAARCGRYDGPVRPPRPNRRGGGMDCSWLIAPPGEVRSRLGRRFPAVITVRTTSRVRSGFARSKRRRAAVRMPRIRIRTASSIRRLKYGSQSFARAAHRSARLYRVPSLTISEPTDREPPPPSLPPGRSGVRERSRRLTPT
jgi:hypothetical protein